MMWDNHINSSKDLYLLILFMLIMAYTFKVIAKLNDSGRLTFDITPINDIESDQKHVLLEYKAQTLVNNAMDGGAWNNVIDEGEQQEIGTVKVSLNDEEDEAHLQLAP